MKSFIIYLPDIEHSARIARECQQQALTFDFEIEMFAGVTGDQAQKIFDQDQIFPFPKRLKHNTNGVKGCAGSHYLLWKQCVQDQVPYVILEQDAYMIRPMPNVLDQFTHVLKLDSHNPYAQDYQQQILQCEQQIVKDYDIGWGYKTKKAPYGGYFRGAWAYVIKPQAAEIAVNSFQQHGWVPADKQFGVDLFDLKTTTCTVFRIHPEYNSNNIEQLSLTRNL